jgi:hypothetical protein
MHRTRPNIQKKFIVFLLLSLINGVAGSSDDSTTPTSSGILGVWALSSALKDGFLLTSCISNSALSNLSWDLMLLFDFPEGFRYSQKDAPDIRHTAERLTGSAIISSVA